MRTATVLAVRGRAAIVSVPLLAAIFVCKRLQNYTLGASLPSVSGGGLLGGGG